VLKIIVGKVPKIIKNADIVNKRFFIRGLFDAEGDVSKIYSRSRWPVRISQDNFKFLKDIQHMLKEIGINTKGPYRFSEAFSIAIYKKSDILNFKKLVGSLHPNKAKRLENLSQNFINTYKLSDITKLNTK
jgi:intein/homing endonuclease